MAQKMLLRSRRSQDFMLFSTFQTCPTISTYRPAPEPSLFNCSTKRIVTYNQLISAFKDKSWIQNIPTRNMHTCTSVLQKYKEQQRPDSSASLTKSKGSGSEVTLSLGEKVKENVKTSAYGSVILIGLAVTGAMGYVILSELFSSESPNNIYTKSFKICKADPRVQDLLGTPIKCYGEETRRGWRRHVAHQQFIHGTTKIIRMKFYVEGKHRKGTVHLEKKTNANGKYEYSYLLVDVDGYPPQRIEIDASRF